MKPIISAIVAVALLASCDSGPSAFGTKWTLEFTDEAAGKLNVRGRDYQIIRRTGRDKETGEVFVVEYRTKVDGRTVTCVGSIDRCPDAIIRELDGGRDKDDHY